MMKIYLEPVPGDVAFICRNEGMDLQSMDDVEEWCRQLIEHIQEKGKGEKIEMLVDISNVQISPMMADNYGRAVKERIVPLTKCIIRFGNPQGMTKSVIEAESILNRYPAQVCADLDGALVLLEKVRKL